MKGVQLIYKYNRKGDFIMENVLILISGAPATGKTTYSAWLSNELKAARVCYDNIKERVVSLQETLCQTDELKSSFAPLPYELFKFMLEEMMKTSTTIVADFIFSNDMQPLLDRLVSEYGYETINVHFDADEQVCYDRFMERNKTDAKNKNIYPIEITFDKFTSTSAQNKVFRYGKNIIEVNTNSFADFSNQNILDKIKEFL